MIECVAQDFGGGEQPRPHPLRKALDQLVDRLVRVPAQPQVVARAPLPAEHQERRASRSSIFGGCRKTFCGGSDTPGGRTDKGRKRPRRPARRGRDRLSAG